MMLVSYMIQHYFGMPYQAFTEKIITAYALLKVVDGVDEDDVSRVRWLQENTHGDIMVSLWKLDRAVNPAKGSFDMCVKKRRFRRNNITIEQEELGAGSIELDEDSMQHYLCEAINEVHEIVVRNIKGYKEELKMDMEMKDESKITFDV